MFGEWRSKERHDNPYKKDRGYHSHVMVTGAAVWDGSWSDSLLWSQCMLSAVLKVAV
jgi:hypothetical protein